MTIAAIRAKLVTMIADADDKKVWALYTLLADEGDEIEGYTLTDEQAAVVNEQGATYLGGRANTSDWDEVPDNILSEILITYISKMENKKVNALYALLEDSIHSSFALTDDHVKILDEEHLKHIEGKSKSYSWEEAKTIIRGKKIA